MSQTIATLVQSLDAADEEQREAIREEILVLAQQVDDPKVAISRLEESKRTLQELEARWEVDEVIEALTPPPVEEPEPTEEAPAPEKPVNELTAEDLEVVYDDPNGLMLYQEKNGDRWFAAQPDPATGRFQMFQIGPDQLSDLKIRLAQSPYWLRK